MSKKLFLICVLAFSTSSFAGVDDLCWNRIKPKIQGAKVKDFRVSERKHYSTIRFFLDRKIRVPDNRPGGFKLTDNVGCNGDNGVIIEDDFGSGEAAVQSSRNFAAAEKARKESAANRFK